jgi:nifR3 family TIM-barrel protein
MRSFRIGSVEVDPPIALAPMEDVTNAAFRLLVKEIGGPGLMFTEFISAMAVRHNISRSHVKMVVRDAERPLAVQIFGAEPEVMAETARVVEGEGADLVDINMGCWVPKVCRQGSGAALLKDPDQAVAIVDAVARAVRVPVTVKLRAGWDFAQLAAPGLAPRFEAAGAQALTLHARTAAQGLSGDADWTQIAAIKSVVRIPVIGNGDIRSPADAERMFRTTGCDGVMIGRAAISNPWFVADVVACLRNEPRPEAPTMSERKAVVLRHLVAHVANLGDEERAVRSLRGQLPLYFKGFPGATTVRERLSRACSVADVEAILAGIGSEAPDRTERPAPTS